MLDILMLLGSGLYAIFMFLIKIWPFYAVVLTLFMLAKTSGKKKK